MSRNQSENVINQGITQANCRKVFLQRDYSEGIGVKFHTRFPVELEGKIDRGQFEYTINTLNTLYAEAEKANCSTYCEGCMACLTAYIIYFCTETHYEKCLKKVSRFVHEQNEQVWTKRGLLITDPIELGLRVVEISLLTEPALQPQTTSCNSIQAALSRCSASQVRDPTSALETLRSLIQPEINIRIQKVLSDIAESHLKPAIRNLRLNLGEENVPGAALEEVCISALENAKEVYQQSLVDTKLHQRFTNNNINNNTISRGGNCPNQVLKRSFSNNSHVSSPVTKKSMVIKSGLGRPNTDLILVNKAGRPVRREGPKWESERLTSDTLFILGSRANKALGFGQTRGRLYIKHPELFKYSGDQTDKEWLAKANLMATTGGKAYLMVLQDILDLAESPEYSSHPKQQPGELVGFTVPDWMLEKMKAYIETAKTNPETTDDELLRMAEEYAEMDEEGKKMRRDDINIVASGVLDDDILVMRKKFGDHNNTIKKEDEMSLEGLMCGGGTDHDVGSNNVAHLFNDIKHESVDDDLDNLDPGFLQGMNLHNLVREFEMDTGSGSELNLLALADDSIQ